MNENKAVDIDYNFCASPKGPKTILKMSIPELTSIHTKNCQCTYCCKDREEKIGFVRNQAILKDECFVSKNLNQEWVLHDYSKPDEGPTNYTFKEKTPEENAKIAAAPFVGAHLSYDIDWPTGTAKEATEKWRSHILMQKKELEDIQKKREDEKIELLAEAKAKEMVEATKKTPLKGLVVFYIDVGQLPPFKAEEFIDRMKEKANLDRFPEEYGSMWIPIRAGKTRIEMLKFDE